MASRSAIILVLAACGPFALVNADSNSRLSNIPGGQTASGIMAASADGISRYLAPDGPIQPALTAIGGLPLRGAELTNNGISRISSGFQNGAQRMSRAAGQNGQIRMPGMQALESSMPSSVANLGSMLGTAISSKNSFIRGQAERGIQAGERLRSAMQNGMQGMMARSSGPMVKASNMLGGAGDAMMKGGAEIQQQLRQSLDGSLGRLQSMQGIGENLRNQAQGLSGTLSGGLQGHASLLQRTGEQVRNQIQSGHQQNTQAMSGIMDSMHNSMGNMGSNMQKNLGGVMNHVQNGVQQVQEQLQQAAALPMNLMQNLGNSLGGMMKGGSSAGRY